MKIGERVVEKAALCIPVQLDGKAVKILVQLDPGAELTQLDAVPYEQLFGKRTAPRTKPEKMPFTGIFGGARVENHPFDVIPERGEKSQGDAPLYLGVRGADFFRKRILILDFVRQQIAILNEGATLPANLEKDAAFVPLTVRDGRLLVPLTINGKDENDFFYDTGASLFTMIAVRAKWQSLTGRTGDELDNEVWRVPAWGREAVMKGAHISGELRVGTARLLHPLVFFDSSAPKGGGTDQLFGNALFQDHFTVIVDIPAKRFGLIEAR